VDEEQVVTDGRGPTVESMLMKAEDVARALKLGRSKVFTLMASGGLPAIRIGRSVRVPRNALEEWIRNRTLQIVESDAPLSTIDKHEIPAKNVTRHTG
jgi:excisionase family DNA binding protein